MNTGALDKRHVWHPFTPLDSWLDPAFQPVSIVAGKGVELIDEQGRRYLDGNSSIWTNLHGHAHPALTQAIKDQLDRIAHSSFLGLTHPLAAQLAAQLSDLPFSHLSESTVTHPPYRVFFSDDGSTALEAALKMVIQYFQQNGQPSRTQFLSLGGGYHGDTLGAMSLGHNETFQQPFRHHIFPTLEVMAPSCYRCPFNRASPKKNDARQTRECSWECVGLMENALHEHGPAIAGVVIEPRVQGAAGMLMHPAGYLSRIADLTRKAGALLIADEVMTGFGRTGTLLACQLENVFPDLIALAKGLTGGYLPLAATLVSESIVEGFRGGPEKTFYHGHSYTANALGCAAALANLETFAKENTLIRAAALAEQLRTVSAQFWDHPNVGDVRQEGTILAVELVRDFARRTPFPAHERMAWKISERARDYGLLTRGIVNVLVLMPPLCTTDDELRQMVGALSQALHDILPLK